MKIPEGSVWRCIDEESERHGKICEVVDIHDNPDFNGDGSITLLYDDGEVRVGKVRRFIPGITHERVSVVTPQERKAKIEEVSKKIMELQRELSQLKKECECIIVDSHESAVCSVCDKDYGWWCPDSTTHLCDYEQEDGTYDEDNCRYCHSPEERK